MLSEYRSPAHQVEGAASQKKVGLKWLEDKLMAQRSFEEASMFLVSTFLSRVNTN